MSLKPGYMPKRPINFAKFGTQKGQPSRNPGGRAKVIKEAVAAFSAEWPKCLELLLRVRDDIGEETKTRMEAARLLLAYGIGPPKPEPDHDDGGVATLPEGLKVETIEAVARRPLSVELSGQETDVIIDAEPVGP